MAVKFEDSNIAMLGSDLEKKVRKNAAKSEKAWDGAGKAEGNQIWRIENFQVKDWPKNQYGTFYSGDSYIVLHTYKNPEAKDSQKLLYNLHFWLGKSTTQDEAGTAAYKTVELDDLLGTLPVQFREVQGYESEEFLSLFKGHIKVQDGGVASGFNHVKPEEYKARLFWIKGTRNNMRVLEVPAQTSSLNHGDVFVLDMGLEIIQWNGETAGVQEKRKAGEVVERLRDERNGKPTATVIEANDDHEVFWKVLGGKGKIKSAEEAGSDQKVEAFAPKLFRVSDASGSLSVKEVGTGKLNWNQLDSKDVFLLDTETTVFIWIGSGASKTEKSKAFQVVNEYLMKYNRPFTMPAVRIIEGAHNQAFDSFFEGTKPEGKLQGAPASGGDDRIPVNQAKAAACCIIV
jgi:gelsolin